MTLSKRIVRSFVISSAVFLSSNIFAGPDYSNQELSYNDMSHQDLSGATFVGSKINNVDFSSSDLTGAVFKDAKLSYLNFKNSNLSGVTFINSDLAHLKMSDIDISNVRFIGSNVEYVKMNGTNLTNVEFANSTLKHVQMKKACLANASFTENDMEYVQLDKSVLIGAKFRSNSSSHLTKRKAIYSGVAECAQGIVAKSRSTTRVVAVATAPKQVTRAIVTNSVDISTALNDKNSGKIDLTINFDFDSDRIKGVAHEQIFEIAQALKSNKLSRVTIEIEGHTDSDGSNDYNLDLSYRRALSVKRELVSSYGIPSSRFSVQGYGESNPVASNRSEMGKALNRRVTLVNLALAPKTVSIKSKSINRKTSVIATKKVTNTKVNLGGDFFNVETKKDGSSKVQFGGDFFNVETKADGSSKVRLGDFFSVDSEG